MRCLESVLRSHYTATEIVVVDDASEYDVASDVGRIYPLVRVFRNSGRRLLSYSRNVGAERSTGELLFFLDDDNVIAEDTISELVRSIKEDERIAVASPIIYYFARPDKVWTSLILRGSLPGFYELLTNVPNETIDTFSFHNSFMVTRLAFQKCGEFDVDVFPIHFSELDFAYRVHAAGLRAVVNPRAKDWHDIGPTHMHVDSVRSYFTLRNRIILLRRYGSKKELRDYVVFVLPLLTSYYLIHHLKSAQDRRFLAASNLLRGVVDGLTMRDVGKSAEQKKLPGNYPADSTATFGHPTRTPILSFSFLLSTSRVAQLVSTISLQRRPNRQRDPDCVPSCAFLHIFR